VSGTTEQKKAAQGDERWHFQQLISGVRDYAIFTLDRTGHVTSWNEGAQNIKGYTAGELIPLGWIWEDATRNTSRLYMFLGLDCRPTGRQEEPQP